MSVAQVNGSAVTSTSTKNDRGVIRRGGNIASTRFTAKNVLGESDYVSSGVKLTTNSGLAKSVSAGTFAVLAVRKYIIRKVTTTLAGVANTVLQSGASDFGNRRAIHKTESARTTFLSALSWTADNDGMPTYAFTKSQKNTAFGNDNAASPTLAVPGELVYIVGNTPVLDDYAAKTLG